QLKHEAAWCSTFSRLETSQARDSAGFQMNLSQNQICLKMSVPKTRCLPRLLVHSYPIPQRIILIVIIIDRIHLLFLMLIQTQVQRGLTTLFGLNVLVTFDSIQHESAGVFAPVPTGTQERLVGLMCEECGKCCKSKAGLVAHRRVHVYESLGTNVVAQ
ncbi:hypothetical protein CSKR_113256, partial [Clonorchis sinensis]